MKAVSTQCMCACVCVCVCDSVCVCVGGVHMCVCITECVRRCLQVCVCVYVYGGFQHVCVCVHACMCACICVHVCVCICVHACVCECVCVSVCVSVCVRERERLLTCNWSAMFMCSAVTSTVKPSSELRQQGQTDSAIQMQTTIIIIQQPANLAWILLAKCSHLFDSYFCCQRL